MLQLAVESPLLPAENATVKLDGGRLTAGLPAVSWSMIRLAVES